MTSLAQPTQQQVRVWFASNREFVAQEGPGGTLTTYLPTIKRAPTLSLGMAEVEIPQGHRRGIIEQPTSFTLSSTPQERFILQTVNISTCDAKPHVINNFPGLIEQSFHEMTSAHPADWQTKRGFVFIHGYNESFEHTLFTAAQIFHDLSFDGTPLVFCWPSAGTYQGYTYDQESLQISRQYLLQFFEALLQLGLSDISLIAHSLGIRLVLEALSMLKLKIAAKMWRPRGFTGSLFKEVIFCHPDISITEFRLQMRTISDPNFEQLADRFAIFANETDKALGVSAPFHGSEELRLGAASTTLSLNSCDLIHAGPLHLSSMDWGHNLYRDNDGGLTILDSLLNHEELDDCPRLLRIGPRSWLAK